MHSLAKLVYPYTVYCYGQGPAVALSFAQARVFTKLSVSAVPDMSDKDPNPLACDNMILKMNDLPFQTMDDYRREKQAENKKLWRENLPSRKASMLRKVDASRQRNKRANLSQDSLTTTRKRHAECEKKRVASLSPESSIERKQRHTDYEWSRIHALPAEQKAALRSEKTKRQRERRAKRTEEEKKQDRAKDAKRKRDKRKADKLFQKKLNGYLRDKSNPKPLWLLCDIYMDNHKIDLSKMDPFPQYLTCHVDLRGKPLHLPMPKFVPGPN